MKQMSLAQLIFICLFIPTLVYAQAVGSIYFYTDEQGETWFTNIKEEVPAQYQNQLTTKKPYIVMQDEEGLNMVVTIEETAAKAQEQQQNAQAGNSSSGRKSLKANRVMR